MRRVCAGEEARKSLSLRSYLVLGVLANREVRPSAACLAGERLARLVDRLHGEDGGVDVLRADGGNDVRSDRDVDILEDMDVTDMDVHDARSAAVLPLELQPLQRGQRLRIGWL
jgi:hypothetical protein